MNLFVTIFGGMLATALLYGLGRFLRLSNFWATVPAAAIPAFAYLTYAIKARPELDEVTMNVVAYVTVASLLYQLYGAKADHASSMHWAPKLMVGFFVAITLFFGGFVYVATQGLPPALAKVFLPDTHGHIVHTGFAGIVDHWDEAASGIPHQLVNRNKLMKLGWRLEVVGLNDMRPGRSSPVAITVRDKANTGVDGMDITLRMGRPGQVPGSTVVLSGSGAGGYHGTLPSLQAGNWVAYIDLRKAGKEIALEHSLEVQ